MSEQATQPGFNGRIMRRWRVVFPDGFQTVTWAETVGDAKHKMLYTRGTEVCEVTPLGPDEPAVPKEAV